MRVYKEKKNKALFRVIFYLFLLSIFGTVEYLNFSYLNSALKKSNDTQSINQRAVKAAEAKIAKRNEPVYITLPGAQKIRAVVNDYTQSNSIWAIVSKTHPIPDDYVPANLKIPDVKTRIDKSDAERSVRNDIESALINMFSAAETDSYYLMIGSGYRSAELQSVYFYGLASSVGEEAANQSIARPGQSEHQTGLAVDISTVSQQCYLSECFAATGDGIWLVENSYKYGFILRYPEGKESITGYSYEPWHFRYVGVDLATAIHDSGLTFDEAWPYLENALATLKSNGAIK